VRCTREFFAMNLPGRNDSHLVDEAVLSKISEEIAIYICYVNPSYLKLYKQNL